MLLENGNDPDGGARLRLRVLQTFEVSVDGQLIAVPMNVQRVLAYLAVRDRPQARLTLSMTLWMDTTEDRACANLRTALWKARQSIGDCVVTDGNYVALSPCVDVDLGRIVRHARRLIKGEGGLGAGDGDASELMDDLLPDWDEEWIMFDRERHRQLRIHALEALCRSLSADGRAGEAIDAGLAAASAEPLRESAQRTLIAAYIAEGNVSEARRQYRAYRELLWDALGVEPSQTLRSIVGLATAVA
ncbi:MAG: transcriptional regulator, family [Ilumatobacteraceae bacterium]|jgi:DNA-binding SARP family transcriptional activator|nr:transcriptional regulator, family [Ilumatobacteraceae bacterium]